MIINVPFFRVDRNCSSRLKWCIGRSQACGETFADLWSEGQEELFIGSTVLADCLSTKLKYPAW
jgi:hypothetical protein